MLPALTNMEEINFTHSENLSLKTESSFITNNKSTTHKKDIKGKGAIKWLDISDFRNYRGIEFLELIQRKVAPAPGGMVDQQKELATKLAEFEEVYEELEEGIRELETKLRVNVPKPAAWVIDPTRQPHWSIVEAKLAMCLGNGSNGSTGDADSAGLAPDQAKIPKQADCLKGMVIWAHPATLRAASSAPLARAAAAAGVHLRADACARPGELSFQRRHPAGPDLAPEQVTARAARGRRRVLVLACGAAARLAAARALAPHVARSALGAQLTLLVLDPADYFRKGKPNEDLELAKIELQVSLGVDTLVARGPNAAERLAALVLGFARALAEEPYKLGRRAVDEEAQFYMRGDNKNCVTVDAQGHGLARLWQRMLGALPQASLEAARALAARCATPRALYQTVTEEGGEALESVGVSRSGAPGARVRRLGPEMANKLEHIFTEYGDYKLE